jgi:predicted metal-dependent hydrolase
MSHETKTGRDGGGWDALEGKALAGYVAYFECFNAGRFYEAHDALETVWLPVRHQRDGAFYKGLIQLAGAFVHVQKRRYGPALALLRRARFHLAPYPALHHGVSVPSVIGLIEQWLERLEGAPPMGGDWVTGCEPRLVCGLSGVGKGKGHLPGS